MGLEREFVLLHSNTSDRSGSSSGSTSTSEGGHDNDTGTTNRPILSARAIDRDVLWTRLRQMKDLSLNSYENFIITPKSVNSGGIICSICALPGFVPVSHLPRKADGSWWTTEEIEAEFVGKEVAVAIIEVSQSDNRIVCSVLKAQENNVMRTIEVGALVTGEVRRVEAFGVFVGLDGLKVSGLLHVSNISRLRVDNPRSVFSVGDRVSALVMGVELDYSNISLSTAELEPEDGDMLKSKERVWEQAEEQAAVFRQQMLEELEQLEGGGQGGGGGV